MDSLKFTNQLKGLVSEGKTREALDFAGCSGNQFGTGFSDQVVLLKGRLNIIQQNKTTGEITQETYFAEIAQINSAILALRKTNSGALPTPDIYTQSSPLVPFEIKDAEKTWFHFRLKIGRLSISVTYLWLLIGIASYLANNEARNYTDISTTVKHWPDIETSSKELKHLDIKESIGFDSERDISVLFLTNTAEFSDQGIKDLLIYNLADQFNKHNRKVSSIQLFAATKENTNTHLPTERMEKVAKIIRLIDGIQETRISTYVVHELPLGLSDDTVIIKIIYNDDLKP